MDKKRTRMGADSRLDFIPKKMNGLYQTCSKFIYAHARNLLSL